MADGQEYPYVLCSGHSNFPDGMAAKNVYGSMGIVFKIEKKTCKIVDVHATFISPVCIDIINDIFVGYDLNNGIEDAIKFFKETHYGLGKKAIEIAIRDAYNQFLIYKSSQKQN